MGSYRRKVLGAGQKSDFWNFENKEFVKQREKLSHLAMNDLLKYLFEQDGMVAIFDATNTTRARRDWILKT